MVPGLIWLTTTHFILGNIGKQSCIVFCSLPSLQLASDTMECMEFMARFGLYNMYLQAFFDYLIYLR